MFTDQSASQFLPQHRTSTELLYPRPLAGLSNPPLFLNCMSRVNVVYAAILCLHRCQLGSKPQKNLTKEDLPYFGIC
jgi:hypothetical protein